MKITQIEKMADAAEMLWTVVANVDGGDWSKQNDMWQKAAARWRDNYFKALNECNLTPARQEDIEKNNETK